MVTMDDSFVTWLIDELEDRGWSQRELARRSGLSATTVSQILTGQRDISPDVCLDFARALRLPPEDMLRRAGHLPPARDEDDIDAEARFLVQKLQDILPLLPAEQQQRVMETAVVLAEAYSAAAGVSESNNGNKKAEDVSRNIYYTNRQ